MLINYFFKIAQRFVCLLTIFLVFFHSISSVGQTLVGLENSSSLSVANFDSSYINNNLSALETFNGGDNGALVIAMDNSLQQNSNGYFNTYAYGLVVALLHADVPVKWAISSTKIKDGIDFSASAKKVAPSIGSTNSYNFKSGPILIYPGYEDQALLVINSYNTNLSSSNKVKVYRLTSTTSIEIRHTLFHKPKAAILNNGSNQDIHEDIFEDAGLESGTHYVTNLNASDIDGTSCVTMVSEPHADDIDAQDVIGVRNFVTNGGNFFAQCAAIRRYEGYGTNQRLLTSNGLDDEDQASQSSTIYYDNPNDAVFQIQGTIKNEGGSIKNFRIYPSNLQSGTATKRYAYFNSNSQIDFKFYGGKVANVNTTSGGNVFYLGGHKYKNDAENKINGRRLLLNTLLIPPSRPTSCGLGIAEPDIALIKTGQFVDTNADLCANVGETVAYTFTVANQGNVSLSNIVVTDALIASIVFVSGDTNNDSNLDILETWTFQGSYSITQADIDAGLVVNTATVQGTDFNSTVVTDISGATITDDTQTQTTLCQNPAIALVKTGVFVDTNSDLCANVSEIINYEFTITNQGNVSLSSILLTDPLVTNAVYTSGDDGDSILQVGETWICNGTYAITQQDIDAGEVLNSASVSGISPTAIVVSDISGDTITNDTPTITDLCQDASIALVKTSSYDDGDCTAAPGDTISYSFSITNTGNVTLTNVVVTDPLVTMVGGPIASLVPGASDSTTYTASYAITQQDIDAGLFINQATATAATADATIVTDLSDHTSVLEDNPTVTILCGTPSIALVKVGSYDDLNDDGDCISAVGDTIAYTFTVTNTGSVTLTNVLVTDPLVTMVGGPIASLAPGATDTTSYTASYSITQQDIDAGQFTNQATASATAPDASIVTDVSGTSISNNVPTVTDICQNDAIAIVKTGVFNDVDTSGCSTALVDTVTYTFTVTSQGNTPLISVTVSDPLLGGLLTAIPSGDTNNNMILEVTETWVYVQDYFVTQLDIDTGSITNQATASGSGVNGIVTDLSGATVTDDTPTVTALCQNNAIALIKTGVFNDANGDNCADVNESITYSFVVKNIGNTTISNIDIDDAMVNVVGGPITLAPGQEDTSSFTAVYLITQVDIDTGSVTNTATVTGFDSAGVVVSDVSDDDNFLEDNPTVTVLCQNNAIALIKTGVFNDANGDNCADVKETITYSFMVKNIGNTTISNIDIDDAMVNVVGGPITLAPGQEDTAAFTAVYLITQANIDLGSITNTAIVSGLNPAGVVVSDVSDDDNFLEDDPTITTLCNNAIIALIKTGTPADENGNGCIDLGETIVYDFVVTNLGNVVLTQVIVTDPMVAIQGGPITILAGESDTETFSAVYTVIQDDVENGLISNQAIAEGLDPSGNVVNDLSDNNSNFEDDSTVSILCQDPSIFLEKEGVFNDENANGFADVGETISYYFSVTNTGNLILFDITVEDPLPGIVVQGGPIVSLDPGQVDSTTFTATYIINQADIDAQRVVNQATVNSVTADDIEVVDTSDDPNNPTNSDPDSDGDPDDPTITPLPSVGAQFRIFNAVSADGNGENDFFFVDGISDWPENNVQIFNRWGVKVFETNGYGGSNDQENVFRGYSDARQTVSPETLLPTGTYYYVITFNGPDNPGNSSYAGYLYLNR